MKQRKATKTQPKKVAMGETHAVGSGFVESGNKMPSGHTKMSTNYTIHSNALEQARKANKVAPRSKSKENPLTNSRKLPNSKSTKKLKINFRPQNVTPAAQESYREYCIIDENFVPIVNAQDHKRLQDILSQTAATGSDFNTNFKNMAPKTPVPQLRRRSSSYIRSEKQPIKKEVEKIDVSTSVLKLAESQKMSIEISAVPHCEEIGLQYSARPEEQVIIKNEAAQFQPVQGQSLSDLLFKLEFSHLGDDKSFSSLSSNQKQHFTQLLETLASKLRGKPQMRPIYFPEVIEIPSPINYSLPIQQQALHPNYQQLQRLVCLRQYHQMNWIQASTQQSQQQVHTSLYSVISFLCHLFCFVEMHYSEEFVYMIQKFYGHTFREKYRRITRGIPLLPDRKFRVIEDAVFLEFINESNACSSPLEVAHLKAIFDAFNEHLEQYRPFYLGNGQQFPWSLKMFVSMSEYSITEDSLHIIFMQVKEKMVEWSSLLCGIVVNHNQKALLPGNPLDVKRNQREEKMLHTWLKQQNFEKDGCDLYSTQALHETAELIYQQLLIELAQELL